MEVGEGGGWGSMLMPVYGEISRRDPIIVSLLRGSTLMERICCCSINFSIQLGGQERNAELTFLFCVSETCLIVSNTAKYVILWNSHLGSRFSNSLLSSTASYALLP